MSAFGTFGRERRVECWMRSASDVPLQLVLNNLVI